MQEGAVSSLAQDKDVPPTTNARTLGPFFTCGAAKLLKPLGMRFFYFLFFDQGVAPGEVQQRQTLPRAGGVHYGRGTGARLYGGEQRRVRGASGEPGVASAG